MTLDRSIARHAWLTLFLVTVLSGVCTTVLADFPPLPAAQTLEQGVQLFDILLQGEGPGQTMRLWVYLPAGQHAAHSLPCVVIAPAGSNLITGMKLADGDRQEHLPYLGAGFAVVAYELDGAKEVGSRKEAVAKFIAADGGVANAKTAIDYLLAKVPEVSPDRIYTAGHSSAATVALDVAAADSRVKACCAYAPVPNLRDRLGPSIVQLMTIQDPAFEKFVDAASPATHVPALTEKPILLFTAADDSNVPTASVRKFAADLTDAGGKQIKLVTVETGGHFQSMIDQGIPAGIAFLKDVDAKPTH